MEVEVGVYIKVEEAVEVQVKCEEEKKDVERETVDENDYLEAKEKVDLMTKRRE
jgi:hypothetical protein